MYSAKQTDFKTPRSGGELANNGISKSIYKKICAKETAECFCQAKIR